MRYKALNEELGMIKGTDPSVDITALCPGSKCWIRNNWTILGLEHWAWHKHTKAA